MVRGKYICLNDECNFVCKGYQSWCPTCQKSPMLGISTKARAPKKNANKSKWKSFKEMFVEPVLKYQERNK